MATQRPGLPKWPCASERCRFLDWIMKSQKKIWLGDRTNIKLRFHNFCWFELVTGYRKGLNVTPPLLQRGSGGEREHKILYCPFCLVEIGVMDRVAFDLDMGPQSEAPRSVKDFIWIATFSKTARPNLIAMMTNVRGRNCYRLWSTDWKELEEPEFKTSPSHHTIEEALPNAPKPPSFSTANKRTDSEHTPDREGTKISSEVQNPVDGSVNTEKHKRSPSPEIVGQDKRARCETVSSTMSDSVVRPHHQPFELNPSDFLGTNASASGTERPRGRPRGIPECTQGMNGPSSGNSQILLDAERSTSTAGLLRHTSLTSHPEQSMKGGPATTRSTTIQPIGSNPKSSYGQELRSPHLPRETQPRTTALHCAPSAMTDGDARRAFLPDIARSTGRFHSRSQERTAPASTLPAQTLHTNTANGSKSSSDPRPPSYEPAMSSSGLRPSAQVPQTSVAPGVDAQGKVTTAGYSRLPAQSPLPQRSESSKLRGPEDGFVNAPSANGVPDRGSLEEQILEKEIIILAIEEQILAISVEMRAIQDQVLRLEKRREQIGLETKYRIEKLKLLQLQKQASNR